MKSFLLLFSLFVFGLSAFAQTYSYDATGRLVAVKYADNSSVVYGYDVAGNRVRMEPGLPPALAVQPLSQAGSAGGSITLSVVASGTGTLTYQWYKDGTAISGATSSLLTVSSLTTANAGSYTVKVTDGLGSTTSTAATVTVNAATASPAITSALLAGGTLDEPFAYIIAASNSPTSYAATGLPAGLSLDTTTGTITGTPTTAGTYTVTLSAINVTGTGTASSTFYITPSVALTTIAGTAGTTGSTNAKGTAGLFKYPGDVTADTGSNLYVADTSNHTIRKVDASDNVTLVAGQTGTSGNTDATSTAARFNYPNGVVVDSSGSVFVSDTGNNAVRKITSAGVVSTFAGSAAGLNCPTDLTIDSSGNLYVADTENHTIRKITSAGGVTVYAGALNTPGSTDATTAANARFNFPSDVAIDSSGNLYVADTGNHTIRKITSAGVVTTLAGQSGIAGSADGLGTAAQFSSPSGLALDKTGNLFVADTDNHVIRMISPLGVVTTAVGLSKTAGTASGFGSKAGLTYPGGLTIDANGYIYAADSGNSTIRVLSTAPGITAQPQNQLVATGTTATFAVSVSAQPTPTYQWFKDGTAINGATSATFSIASAQSADPGTYKVTISQTVGGVTTSVTSAGATLSLGSAPTITTQPQNQTVTAGANVTLSVVATGTPTPTYLWYKDSAAISGATSATLSLSSVQSANAGSYKVTVTNAFSSIDSTAVTLTVNAASNGSSSSSGGGGGGGAPSSWFFATIFLLSAIKRVIDRKPKSSSSS